MQVFVIDRLTMDLPEKIFIKLCEEDDKFTPHDSFKNGLIMEWKVSSNANSVDNHINGVKKLNNFYVNYSVDRMSIVCKYDAKNRLLLQYRIPLLGRSFLRTFLYELCLVNEVKLKNDCTYIIDKLKLNSANYDQSRTFNCKGITVNVGQSAKSIFFKSRALPLPWKTKIEQK